MLVKDIMSTDLICVDATETAAAAARLLSRRNVGILPVCRGSLLVGVVTDRDIVLRCVAAGLSPENTRVSQIMTQRVSTVAPEDDVSLAIRKMAGEQVRRLPVVKERQLVGMVSVGDVARKPDFSMEAAACLCDVCENIAQR